MKRNESEIDAIEHTLNIATTPANLFKALTSQTELRKWWAPRVIMSRFIVSIEEGRDAEMRPLHQEKNHLVRYSWRALDWAEKDRDTVINLEIRDLGSVRGRAGEGVQLSVMHDNWSNKEERDRADRIWKKALASLKAYLEGKEFKPWWETEKGKGGYKAVKLPAVRQFIERLERETRAKPERRNCGQIVTRFTNKLDGQGGWYLKDTGNEVELRFSDIRVFGVLKNGSLSINWRDLETLAGRRLGDFANRFSLDQNMDVHVGKNHEKFPIHDMDADLFAKWCIDLLQIAREERA